MPKIRSEIRMIWLMVLIIAAVSAWFLDIPIVTYLSIIALVMSVMQYVDDIQKPADRIAEQAKIRIQHTSKIPLYISSIIAVVGGVIHWSWLVGIGATAWIFFFLRWLRRLEDHLNLLHQRILTLQLNEIQTQPQTHSTIEHSSLNNTVETELSFFDQIKRWIFNGNPVLKIAILVLVIGVILLLRFATEHWQLSLALKLGIVASCSAIVCALGIFLYSKNRSFALALQGLGLAGLFLTLFFAYYNHVISTLLMAGCCYAIVMLITLFLSLKQQSIELALMAMLIAYVAPFTLPVREISALELVGYYVVINVAVAVLSTLRPWKFLNQIAFLATVLIGGGYTFLHGHVQDRNLMTGLVLVHTAIFIWLSFRFSQLIAQSDIEQYTLKPVLDLALIFSAPIVGYGFIYLMYFHETAWQAGMSLVFALVFAVLFQLAKKNQSIHLIAQSYLSLMLIFLALIPPILLPEQWSVMGWAVEGAVIYGFALYRSSEISRYLAMGLLLVAGFTSIYYLVVLPILPTAMFWVLSFSYLTVVVLANSRTRFQQQMSMSAILFLSVLTLLSSIILVMLLLDYFDGSMKLAYTLLTLSVMYVLINEAMVRLKATWSWLIPKWFGVVPVMIFALGMIINLSHQGTILWSSLSERIVFLLAGLCMTLVWLRPIQGLQAEKEWVSLGTLSALALSSLALISSMPFIGVVIFPLIFCAWSAVQKSVWSDFWQARTSLLLMMIWIITSQLFSQQAFQAYFLPILNPFDLVSLAMLAGFIWLLNLQLKSGLDQSIVAILMVLSLLWLSSYILLRAMHFYLATPYNDLALWDNAAVQLSFTLLWVSLAFVTMSLASRKQLRPLWILGGSILCIVTLKLVLLDLSHVGTLMRVISFLGAGLVMLIIAYIAPIPDTQKDQLEDATL